MATLINGKVTYQGGEALPALGSAEYNQAAAGNLPPVNPVTPISGSSIGTVTPLNIPTPSPTTASSGLAVATAATNNTPTPTTPTADTGIKSDNPILQKLSDLIGQQGTEGAKTAQYNTEQDITGKTQALNDINNRITTTTKAYTDQINKIRKNETGLFGGAVEQNASIVQREADQHLADLAIIKSVTQGDLDTAQKIVDSKIKAEFEPIDNQIKSLENFYQLNQSDLSDSQKIALEAKISAQKDYRDSFLSAKQDAYKMAIDAGADVSVLNKISNAQSEAQAYGALNGTPGIGGSKGKASSVQIALGAKKLQASKGPDGYVDPAVYQTAYTDWINSGFAPEDFLNQFPPSSWVNPANTDLPVYLRPKSTGRGL